MPDSCTEPCVPPLVSIVVPVFNEEVVLPEFFSRLSRSLQTQSQRFELIFVDDGSTDATRAALDGLHRKDERVGIIELSRNFGKEIALTAGIDHARGDAVVLIDADLQDPPELIPELLTQWHAGYDVVYGQRQDRRNDPWLKRISARAFYKVAKVRASTTSGGCWRLQTHEPPRSRQSSRYLKRRNWET